MSILFTVTASPAKFKLDVAVNTPPVTVFENVNDPEPFVIKCCPAVPSVIPMSVRVEGESVIPYPAIVVGLF